MPEEGRCNYADVGAVILVIENVERIQRDAESRRFLPRFGQHKIVRNVNVQPNQTRSVQRIAQYSDRTIIRDSVVVIIAPGCDRDGAPGVKGERGTHSEEPARLHRSQQIELVPAIIIRTCPVSGRAVAVRGEVGDPASIVVCLAECVLYLAGKKLAGVSSKSQLQRIALLIAFRLNLPLLSQARVWSRKIVRRNGRVRIYGTKQVDPA